MTTEPGTPLYDEAIQAFATACETLNDYARVLQWEKHFSKATTGTDIRIYKDGWRLEKYIEAELVQQNGYSATWWLELKKPHEHWVVCSSLSITHSSFYLDLDELSTVRVEELRSLLSMAVDRLVSALDVNVEFQNPIRSHRPAGGSAAGPS